MSTQRVCLQCNMVTTYLCETRFPAVYSLPDLSHAGASHGGYSKPLLQSLPITPLIPESILPLACACDASTRGLHWVTFIIWQCCIYGTTPIHDATKTWERMTSVVNNLGKSGQWYITTTSSTAACRCTNVNLDIFVWRYMSCPMIPHTKVPLGCFAIGL